MLPYPLHNPSALGKGTVFVIRVIKGVLSLGVGSPKGISAGCIGDGVIALVPTQPTDMSKFVSV